jgi:hypothetical protein
MSAALSPTVPPGAGDDLLGDRAAKHGGARKSRHDEITEVFQFPAFGSICSPACAAPMPARNALRSRRLCAS